MTRRLPITVMLVVGLFAALTAPAGATRAPAVGADPADGHKITICHATRSLSNPYVEITIDVAAWNQSDDPRHHGDHHTRTKQGTTWSDYVLTPGEECSLDQPPPPQRESCAGVEMGIVVEFSGDKLIAALEGTGGILTDTVSGLNIPAGTYNVVLGSSDEPHTLVQDNEQWRADFGGLAYSTYAADLPDGWPAFVVRTTHAESVTLSGPISSIVAEHWDANPSNTSKTWDSVIPVCVGLTRTQ